MEDPAVGTDDSDSMTSSCSDESEREIKSGSETKPGDIVEFERFRGAYRHIGVAKGEGKIVHLTGTSSSCNVIKVICGSTSAEVREDDFKDVKGHGKAYINNSNDKYLRHRKGEKAAEHARKMIGRAKYNINSNNCQHFAHEARYGVPFSDQSLGSAFKNFVSRKKYKHKALPPKETRTEDVTETSDVVRHIGLSKGIQREENSLDRNEQKAHNTSVGKVKGGKKQKKVVEHLIGDSETPELAVSEVRSSLYNLNIKSHQEEDEPKEILHKQGISDQGADHDNTYSDGDETDSVDSCTYDGDDKMDHTWIYDGDQRLSLSSACRGKFVSPTTTVIEKDNDVDEIDAG